MTRYVTCPAPDADLQEVIRFALSHNGYERLGREVEALTLLVEPVLNTVGTAGAAPEWAGIDLLRGALFFLQRQSHHWGDVPPHQEARMRLLVAAIARVYPGPLVDDDGGPDAEASMSRGEVMEAARALCPEVGQQRDALRDLVLTLGWHAESVPGRVIVYEALRLTCGEAASMLTSSSSGSPCTKTRRVTSRGASAGTRRSAPWSLLRCSRFTSARSRTRCTSCCRPRWRGPGRGSSLLGHGADRSSGAAASRAKSQPAPRAVPTRLVSG